MLASVAALYQRLQLLPVLNVLPEIGVVSKSPGLLAGASAAWPSASAWLLQLTCVALVIESV
jgi:hypothetical protein